MVEPEEDEVVLVVAEDSVVVVEDQGDAEVRVAGVVVATEEEGEE